jgi:DNA-binding NtrC family response regulator
MTSGSRLEADPSRVVTVLLVSSEEQDHRYFRSLFSRTNWTLHGAYSSAAAIELLSSRAIPVVVAEERLPGRGWEEILRAVESLPAPPKTVVAASAGRQEFLAEVLNLGGYDVLLRPFDPQEVLHCLSMAWLSWKYDRERAAARQCA